MSEDRAKGPLLAIDPLAARSPLLVAFFARILAQAMARDFHAVRLSGELPELPEDRPAVVYANHPSWWDPALFAVLTHRCLGGRQGYGPIDVEALARYRFMSRIGLFGIESSRRGARRFLRTSVRILDEPSALLWITPEGRFTDPRQRPVRLRPGLAHLARRAQRAIFVPMAVEYVFWTERRPEALCRFGTPFDPATRSHRDISAWSVLLQDQLATTMDALAEEAISRDPRRFRVVLRGRSGVGGVYDLWRRAGAALRHERFRPEHGQP
jgi:1-acyl-sn-glycerol-3-phosphate acyltransferase